MARSDDPLTTLVEDIDRRLPGAYAGLTAARQGFVRCPSAGRQQACELAEAHVNELLDLRLAVAGDRLLDLVAA